MGRVEWGCGWLLLAGLCVPVLYIVAVYAMFAPQPVEGWTADSLRDEALFEVPASARAAGAFVPSDLRGGPTQVWMRLHLAPQDVRPFMEQKALAGKWRRGKHIALPRQARRAWPDFGRARARNCWSWSGRITVGSGLHAQDGDYGIVIRNQNPAAPVMYVSVYRGSGT